MRRSPFDGQKGSLDPVDRVEKLQWYRRKRYGD